MGVIKYENQYRQVFGGFDGGVELGLEGGWRSDAIYRNIQAVLADAKTAAENEPEFKKVINLGGRDIAVWAKGSNGDVKYKFVFEYQGTKVYVHSNPKGNIQPVRVRFGFQALAKHNLFDLFDDLSGWLREVGLRIDGDKLTRVDMQIMTERPVNEYVDKIRGGNQAIMLARGAAKIYEERNGDISSYTVGKAVEFCIYDKRKQLLQKSNAVDYEIFRREILDNGPLPEVLTRIEFRVKREMLKRYGVNSMADLRCSVLGLLEILTNDWFRILAEPKHRGHENTQKVADCWLEVQEMFQYYFDEENQKTKRSPEELKAHVPKKENNKAENLVKQMMGCAASYAAITRSYIGKGIEDIKEFICEIAVPHAARFAEKFELKRMLNLVERGFTAENNVDFSDDDYMSCLDDRVLERVRQEIRENHVALLEVPF